MHSFDLLSTSRWPLPGPLPGFPGGPHLPTLAGPEDASAGRSQALAEARSLLLESQVLREEAHGVFLLGHQAWQRRDMVTQQAARAQSHTLRAEATYLFGVAHELRLGPARPWGTRSS